MTRPILAAALALSLAGCQSVEVSILNPPANAFTDGVAGIQIDVRQTRGNNSPSTLPIEVRDSPVAVNSGADQSRDAE